MVISYLIILPMKISKNSWLIIFTLFFVSAIVIGSIVYAILTSYLKEESLPLSILISFVSIFVISVIFVIFYFLFTRNTTISTDDITDEIIRLTQGDYTYKFNIDSDDGHYRIKHALNELSDKIESLFKHFDEEVSKKVAEIKSSMIAVESQNVILKETKMELEKYRQAVTEAPIHIIITNPDGKILYANKASTKITGYSVSEMVGNTSALWGRQMPSEFYQKLWKTIKEDQVPFISELTNRNKDGRLYEAEIRIVPVLNPDNQIAFYVGIEEDITQRKQTDRMKTEFITLASHQLRTPVTIIRWLLEQEISHIDSLPKEDAATINAVYEATIRMVELIRTLLNISRLDAGKLIVYAQDVSVTNLIRDIIKNITLRFKSKNIEIQTSLSDNKQIIYTDPGLLTQILENLLSNAVKYSNSGQKVYINVSRFEKEMEISVADQGIGIPDNQKDRIFERFFRADNVIATLEEGSGLGLYLTKQLVLLLGGSIRFESVRDKGTTFFVKIPIKFNGKK